MRTKKTSFVILAVLLCMSIAGSLTGYAAETTLMLYAAPDAAGSGDGSSIENAAYFRDARLWQSVNTNLQNQPVTVNLVPGQYIFSKLAKDNRSRETLRLSVGHPEHQFIMQGLHKEGTVFTSDPNERIDETLSIELLRFTGMNAVFRNIHFTGKQHMGYTTHFAGQHILIEDCSFTDLVNAYYGASGTAYATSEYITWKNNYFHTVGLDSHAHMLYNSGGPQHVYVIGNHFEDCSGEYVRFRDQTDYVVVYGNTFVSSGTYRGVNRAFISIPLFNDDNPESPASNPSYEYFGTHMLIVNNSFNYPDNYTAGDRIAFRFLQSGYDPPGRNLLLSSEEARFLQTAPIEERKAFMLKNFGIDAERIFFADNTVQGWNATNSLYYISYSSYGAVSRGWRDHIDITPTVNTSTVVTSGEEAMAFWDEFIESHKYFLAPRDGDVLKQPLPIQLKTPAFNLSSVQVALDGAVIYSGTTMPTDLVLTPAQLTADRHLLAVVQKDTAGKEYNEEIAFTVEHLGIESSTSSSRARGVIPLTFNSYLPSGEYQSVAIGFTSVVEGTRTQTTELYSADTLPATLELNSVVFPDGAYDLDVNYTTRHGVTDRTSRRFVLDNWDTIEDQIQPPNTSSWFGHVERLLTVDRSTGWEFTEASPESFFGDSTRIKPASNTAEYLTWQLADLHSYAFTIYVRDVDVNRVLAISTSVDGATWTASPYKATLQEENAQGWQQVLVEGTIPEGQSIKFVRFSVNDPSAQMELGHTSLLGRLY